MGEKTALKNAPWTKNEHDFRCIALCPKHNLWRHRNQGNYLDKLEHFARKTESEDALQIQSELDRIYLHTTSAVEVRDLALNRRIQVHKTGSASTVVWNPWIAKGQQMPDFGNEDYRQMVCVESGNVCDPRRKSGPIMAAYNSPYSSASVLFGKLR